jgi:glycosyltransferase involved in cell wall biosynthesis
LLAGETVAVSGGSERRALSFLRALERRGRYELSLITFDHRAQAEIGAVRIVRDQVYASRPVSPFARVRSRLLSAARRVESEPSVTAAWEEADAQVYVAFGVGDYCAGLALWADGAGRHLVLVAGSDADFSSDYRPDAVGRNPYGGDLALCYEAVRRVGTIVVQTRTQQHLARERFGRESVVIANPVEMADDDTQGVPTAPAGHALWIGKSDRVKRPEPVLAIARQCPDVRFKMVVNPVDTAAFAALQRQRPANVDIVERASGDEIAALFAGAFCLLNTSVFEGFPNTFLEAGRHGVPVASLTGDPDDIVAQHGAGVVAKGDLDALAEAVRGFDRDREAARRAGANLRGYMRTAHDAPARLAEFDRVIDGLMRRVIAK